MGDQDKERVVISGRDIRRAQWAPASRGVAGYVRAMRRVRRARERVERMRERVRPAEDALRRALADAQARRGRLNGGQLADAARRLAVPPLADAPSTVKD